LNKPLNRAAVNALPEEQRNPILQAMINHQERYPGSRLSGLELLLSDASIKLSIPEVLAIFPKMKPRHYSLASSLSEKHSSMSICITVAKGTTPSGFLYKGTASGNLDMLACADVKNTEHVPSIWISVKQNRTFRLPPPGVPLIMVGTGSGIAPFMSFLQELRARQRGGAEKCTALLFFGCRNPDSALYKSELESFQVDGTIAGLHLAFSRVGEKKYVQDVIKQQGAAIWPLLSAGGHIAVCGDASRMAPDVRNAFAQVASEAGGVDGAKFVNGLCASNNRYHEDVWPHDA